MRISLSITFFLLNCALLATAVATSCSKPVPTDAIWLKARVLYTADKSCGMPILDFAEDSNRIRALRGYSTLEYLSSNLPESLDVQDKPLYVYVDPRPVNPAFICPDVDSVHWLRIQLLDSKPR